MADRIITADEARALLANLSTPWRVAERPGGIHRGAVVDDCGEVIAECYCTAAEGHGAQVAAVVAVLPQVVDALERAERERDALLAEKGAWINLGTSADLRSDRMLAALARIGVVVHTRATAPSLDLAERQLRSDVAAARELADAVLAEIAQLRTTRVELAAERDRLARILAVERGDQTRAPAGWLGDHGVWWRNRERGSPLRVMRRPKTNDQPVTDWGPPGEDWTRPTALEAMEAIDAGVTHAG